MPTYEDALDRAVQRVPFSTGTEWDAWVAAWCLRDGAPCRHDRQLRGADELWDSIDCPLVDVALLNARTPQEWGERTSALGGGMYTCSKYEAE